MMVMSPERRMTEIRQVSGTSLNETTCELSGSDVADAIAVNTQILEGLGGSTYSARKREDISGRHQRITGENTEK
jgi:hypothetical protein